MKSKQHAYSPSDGPRCSKWQASTAVSGHERPSSAEAEFAQTLPTVFYELSSTSFPHAEKLHMTTIAENTGFVTLINVFTVEPANQQELLTLLARATDTSVRHVPGFVSAALHGSVDGTKVAMYAQWQSAEHYQAMRSNPVASPYLEQALAIAKFDPGMYEVVKVFSAPTF